MTDNIDVVAVARNFVSKSDSRLTTFGQWRYAISSRLWMCNRLSLELFVEVLIFAFSLRKKNVLCIHVFPVTILEDSQLAVARCRILSI